MAHIWSSALPSLVPVGGLILFVIRIAAATAVVCSFALLRPAALQKVATNTDHRKNAGTAVLYECVQTILSIEAEPVRSFPSPSLSLPPLAHPRCCSTFNSF